MSAHRQGAANPGDPGATVSIYWIRNQLGRRDYGDRRIVSYVALLVEQCGFPPPLPSLRIGRRRRGQQRAGPAADSLRHEVTLDSQWRRAAVEAWLDDQMPPGNAGQVEERARKLAAQDMDRRASALQLVPEGRAA